MKHFLRKAWNFASAVFDKIIDIKVRAGFLLYRAMADDTFFNIDTSNIQSRPLKRIADFYERSHKIAQEKIYNALAQKIASGDLTPRPSMKPAFMKAAEALAVTLPRINFASPTMLAGITIAAVTGAVLSAPRVVPMSSQHG